MSVAFWIGLGGTLVVFFTLAAYTTLAERKISAYIQDRVGPNRVGPWGLLQPLADVLKLVLKEALQPSSTYQFLQLLSPVLMVTLAMGAVAILPLSPHLQFFQGNIGILYLLGVLSMGVYGLSLAGWSTGSKYSLLGGLRSGAQVISYELSLGTALLSVLLLTAFLVPNANPLLPRSIVEAQKNGWFFLLNPVGFIIYTIAAFAEANRAPFDLVEAEQELVGGYHTEYSAIRFGAFFVAEYMNVITASALISTFFFGGYLSPLDGLLKVSQWSVLWQNLWGAGWLLLKTILWVFIFIWVRWTLPRFRYDQLMIVGWKVLLPLGVINLGVLAGILLVIQ
ncbi:MAG: NADH-quinone oxidoreductase subunit H [Bacteroidia bacterium]|nr:NADH-quinone oxidoreductase subunit H [Bacteroidia bacterium]MDW8235272.1 complex I subunit 1 family protein [Bacteroidia bacterium]